MSAHLWLQIGGDAEVRRLVKVDDILRERVRHRLQRPAHPYLPGKGKDSLTHLELEVLLVRGLEHVAARQAQESPRAECVDLLRSSRGGRGSAHEPSFRC
jgi:hypothetical protein